MRVRSGNFVGWMKATPGETALSKKGSVEGFPPRGLLLYRRISITGVQPDLFRWDLDERGR